MYCTKFETFGHLKGLKKTIIFLHVDVISQYFHFDTHESYQTFFMCGYIVIKSNISGYCIVLFTMCTL